MKFSFSAALLLTDFTANEIGFSPHAVLDGSERRKKTPDLIGRSVNTRGIEMNVAPHLRAGLSTFLIDQKSVVGDFRSDGSTEFLVLAGFNVSLYK